MIMWSAYSPAPSVVCLACFLFFFAVLFYVRLSGSFRLAVYSLLLWGVFRDLGAYVRMYLCKYTVSFGTLVC